MPPHAGLNQTSRAGGVAGTGGGGLAMSLRADRKAFILACRLLIY